MENCFDAKKFSSFSRLSFLSLTVFGIGASVFLTAAITIAIAEPLQFVCLTTAGIKAIDRIQEQGREDYGMRAGQFPIYAFVLLDFLPILLVCFLYQVSVNTGEQKMVTGCCRVSTAYVSILFFRILVLAVLVPLQWGYFYPVLFPAKHVFTLLQTDQVLLTGYNFTKDTNATIAPLVYNCKNRVAVAKSTLSIVLFLVRCFVLVLSLMEMIQLANRTRKFNGNGSFLNDQVFCQNFLEMEGCHDAEGRGLCMEERASQLNAPTSQPTTLPEEEFVRKDAGHQDVSTSQSTASPEDSVVKEAAGCPDISSSQAPTSPEDPVTKEVKFLLHNMREEYKRREAFLHPFPWCEDFQLSLNKIYTKVRMVTRKKERSELTEKRCSLYEVFQPHEECGNPRVVLLEGKPGMGKTVSCQKVTFDWSMGETNGFLNDVKVWLKIKCRDLKNADIKEAIIGELLPLDLSQEVKTAFFKHIKSSESGVLLVLDGLDELEEGIDLFPLIKGKLFPHCRLLLTSRNNPKLRQYCDTLFQIIGFTREHAKDFIVKYFRNNEEKRKILLDRIESLGYEEREEDEEIKHGAYFEELLSSPLNTALLCLVVEDMGRLPSRTTELYQDLTGCLLRRHYKKKKQEPPVDPIATHEEDLAALGRLALEGIKNDRLHFNQDDLHTEDRATTILDYGFLSKETSTSILNPRSSYQFLHKTLQEFFAALSFQLQILSGNAACFEYLSEATGHVYKYKQVAIFLVGLLSQKAEAGNLCVRLVSSITQSISNYDDDSSFLYICELIRESVSDELQQDLQAAVVSSFIWEELYLINTRINENSVEYQLVCQAVKENCPLEKIYLGDNEIKDINLLAHSMVSNSTLKSLSLYNNQLLLTGVRALAQALHNNKTLECLWLDKKWSVEPTVQKLKRHNLLLDIQFL